MITEKLAEFIVNTNYEAIPEEARRVAKDIILDGVGVTLAGSVEPLGGLLKKYLADIGGSPTCTVIGAIIKSSAPNAAFANGTMCHALDYDNTWYPMTHPTSPTLPAILALGEQRGVTGKKVIEALVVAFEVQARIRIGATKAWPLFARDHFHPPGVYGPVAAAAGACKVLDLDELKTRQALGIASSRCSGLKANIGTMVKSSHCGNAARAGVEAALLAEMGWDAHTSILEGEGGWADAFFGEGVYQEEVALEKLANPYHMVSPGVGFKAYPANFYTHRPIDAALELREKHGVLAEDLASITVRFPDVTYVNRPSPKTGLDGKFSIQYTMAAAILDGRIVIDSFADRRRFSPDVEELLPKIQVEHDSSIPSDFAETYVVVTARMNDGRVHTARVDKPRGIWGKPLTVQERVAKFYDCAKRVLADVQINKVIAGANSLEEIPDIRDWTGLLSGSQT